MKFSTLMFTLIFVFLASMAECVVIDTAMLESAEALQTGNAKVLVYLGGGIDVNKMLFTPDMAVDAYNNTKGGGETYAGVKAGIGLGKGFEFIMSSASGSGSFPAKASLKYVLPRDQKWTMAIMPGYYYYKGEGPTPGFMSDPRPFVGQYRSMGWEFPVIASLFVKQKIASINLSAKLCTNRTKYKRIVNPYYEPDDDPETLAEGAFNSTIIALSGGVCMRWNYFVLRPEVGLYIHEVHGSNNRRLLPVINIGAGLEFD